MTIFITGATGYVGHQLALRIARDGNTVHVLARDPSSPNIPSHQNIKVFKGDIVDRGSVALAMKGCEQVFHTAALVRLWTKNRADFYKVNVEGTHNILAEADQQSVKKVVFTSTCGVMGPSIKTPLTETDPRHTSFDNDYEFSKSLAEDLVKRYFQKKGLCTTIVALSKVFGPGVETHPMSVNRVINKFLKGNTVFIPKPSHYLANYCFIDDVVNGHLLAMEKGTPGEKYILGGENISYKDLFAKLRSVSGLRTRVVEVPRGVVKFMSGLQFLACKLIGREPFYNSKGVRHIFCHKAYSSEKAIRELGYQPTPVGVAMQKSLHFFKETYNG